MKDPILVAEGYALAKLMHKAANGVRIQSASLSMRIHIPLQILFAELEYQNQFRFCMNNVV